MGKIRDMFKEIKEIIGSRSSSCGTMKLSTGRVVSEGYKKEIETIYRKSIQKKSQYKLYF